jgi:hypothetical protein
MYSDRTTEKQTRLAGKKMQGKQKELNTLKAGFINRRRMEVTMQDICCFVADKPSSW